jgi:hypothetical protein
MTRWRGGLLGALALVLCWTAPAQAAPRLTASRVISPAGTSVTHPAVAVSTDGRMLAAWDTPRAPDMDTGHGRIEARLGQVGHAWSKTEIVSRDGEAPISALGMGGTAAVAWSKLGKGETHAGRTSIFVSIAAPGRRFGRARLVASGTRLSRPEGLEVLPGGKVVVVWSREIQEGEGVNSIPLKDVDFAQLGAPTSPTQGKVIAVGDNGSLSVTQTAGGAVLIAYPTAPTGEPWPAGRQADVITLLPDETSSELVDADPNNPNAEIGQAEVAAGPSGAALTFADKVDELEPNGSFGTPLIVGESPQETAERETANRESIAPRPSTGPISTEDLGAAFPADGAQVAIWERTRALTPVRGVTWRRVMVAVRPTDAGTFGAPTRLSFGAGLSGAPQIATAGAATLALWTQNTRPCKQQVFAAVRPGGRTFSSATAISSDYRSVQGECYFGAGQLALAGSDRYAIAGWAQNGTLHVATLTG